MKYDFVSITKSKNGFIITTDPEETYEDLSTLMVCNTLEEVFNLIKTEPEKEEPKPEEIKK